MGHFLSRAIKRFTQCNSGTRNQLHESNQNNWEQQATTNTGPRDQDPGRPTVQSIPVGQSIDSAEYAAFKAASSSIDRNRDNSASTSQNEQSTVNDLTNPNNENKHETVRSQKDDAENEANDQNEPQVEEAVIKIQALVRGHLTRKALKDAQQQQQAAMIPPNALGQSQFDEESLRNPPNVLFSNVSPPQPPQATNTSNLSNTSNNQQQSNKPANNRVPPLESIAEDVESTNATRAKKKLSSPKSISDTSGESAGSQSTSPSNEANASIDLHCDTPASASIDIMDHSTRLMPGIAAVLHHREPSPGQEAVGELEGGEPISTQPGEALANGNSSNNNNNNFKLQNGSSLLDDQRRTITTSSLPSSPPHINLALATNSHSIDSAEAAAIRIQSAFRGYHTRKHSPYRRRSPASAPVGQINNGPSANGQPKRNTLRQQNATILDDEDGHEGQSDVDECRLDQGALEQGNEETRQSRERHRVDEPLAAQPNVTQVSHDEITSTDDQSTVKELPSDQSHTKQALASYKENEQTVLSAETAHGATAPTAAAALTSAEQGEQWSNNRLSGLAPAEARWSTSLDTDSSNLGAALSLTDDLSEGISQASQDRGDGLSGHRESLGAAIEDAADSHDPVERDKFGQVSESSVSKQLDELERATDQLEAALEEATDNEVCSYGDQLAANLADSCQGGESQQNLNELESDDIERRHPSGVVSVEPLKEFDDSQHQAALLEASNSLDDQEQDQEVVVRAEQQLPNLDLNQARLEAISPDEAIGSSGSSPALVASNGGNSSDDGADSDQEQDGQHQLIGATSGGAGWPTRPADSQQAGNNRNRKRNRNKKKGKK